MVALPHVHMTEDPSGLVQQVESRVIDPRDDAKPETGWRGLDGLHACQVDRHCGVLARPPSR